MARGVYNTVLAAWYGSGSTGGAPYVQRVSGQPCRVVDQEEIFQGQPPFQLCSKWLTTGAARLSGPKVYQDAAHHVVSEYQAADIVEVGSMPGVYWVVCRLEICHPREGPPYDRWLLLPAQQAVVAGLIPPLPYLSPTDPQTTCATATPLPIGTSTVLRYPYSGGTWWYRLTGVTGEPSVSVTVDAAIQYPHATVRRGPCPDPTVMFGPDPSVGWDWETDSWWLVIDLPYGGSGVAGITFELQ